MELLWNGVAAIARLAIWCGGAMLFAAAGIVTAEVTLRKIIPSILDGAAWIATLSWLSVLLGGLAATLETWKVGLRTYMFSGSDEISGYLFAVGTTWSMAHVLMARGHVRIDALYGHFGPRFRAFCDLLSLLMLGIFLAALIDRAWDVAWTSYTEHIRSNTGLRIWLAWPQFGWFGGIALFFIALVLVVLRTLALMLRGDLGAVAQIAGIPSQDEEIETELKGLGLETPRDAKS
jgi:TRAP-type mannitol/chloroaromatic compound transport system permease small subunit